MANRPLRLDVVTIGNALVDILVRAGEDHIESLGLSKGAMTLVGPDRIERAQEALDPETHISGGSAANTAVGLASLGSAAGFIGRVDRDELGRVFSDDINRSGVFFRHHAPDRNPVCEGPIGPGTGRCFVLVTPDAERTMATYLGVAGQLDDEDIDEELIGVSRVTYLEGYLWDLHETKQAMRHAARVAHRRGNLVALSLSDPFVVSRHRDDLRALIEARSRGTGPEGEYVDIVFGNAEEVKLLYGTDDADEGTARLAGTGVLVACTRGAAGSVVFFGNDRVDVGARATAGVVDTTGAGDLYAAGFLAGLTRHSAATGEELVAGADLRRCAELGSLAAAEIISHMGSRPEGSLAKMAADHGLL